LVGLLHVAEWNLLSQQLSKLTKNWLKWCCWSLCCVECKLVLYWTSITLTPCTIIYCASFELKYFNLKNKKTYVLFESAINFHWNWSLAFCVNSVALKKITLILQKIHRFNTIVLAKLFNIREHIFSLFTVLSKPKQIKGPKKGGLLKKVKIWENIKM
jgi:hypothetical protein